MKHAAKLLLFLPLASAALGQAIPAATGPAFYTGFRLPDVSGTLRFSLGASERISLTGANAGYGDTTDFNGAVAYLSGSATQPFSLIYSGGYLISDSGNYPNQIVQNLALSQVLVHGKFKFVISDAVNYLPESPTSGLSGVPGLGDANLPPANDSGQDVLTNRAQRITNRVSGTIERELTGRTSLSGTGSQSIIRYLNVPTGSTLDENSYTALASLNHQFNARTSGSVRYIYNTFEYVSIAYGITTQLVGVQLERSLSRRATVSVFVGPQHVTSTNSALVPPRTNVSGNASLSYNTRQLETSLVFSQATTAGSGLVAGLNTTSVHLLASRQLGRAWHASASAGYIKNSSLTVGSFSSESLVFGAQINRSITEHLSAYTSYTAQHQILSGTSIPSVALNGLYQTLAFGVTFAPPGIHIGH